MYYVHGFDALTIENVAKGILKSTSNAPFHIRQVVIERIAMDPAVVYFDKPPGIACAEVVVQELLEEEAGKVKAWRVRLVALNSNTHCQACAATHKPEQPCPATMVVGVLSMPTILLPKPPINVAVNRHTEKPAPSSQGPPPRTPDLDQDRTTRQTSRTSVER